MENVLITGVSSGIGKDACVYLTQKGYKVFGSVRDLKEGQKLKEKLGEMFVSLVFDVRDKKAIKEAYEFCLEHLKGEQLDVLINNAGIAFPGPLSHIPENKFDEVYEVNVKGVMNVTNQFLPLLGAQLPSNKKPGKIINISSVSGLFSTPFNGAYCMSKYALESMCDVYRRELMIFGIDVISIEPGPVETDIWDKVQNKAHIYRDTPYADFIEHADRVIQKMAKTALPVRKMSILIEKIIRAKKPKTRYLMHKNKLGLKIMANYLPDRWVDRLIRKQLYEKAGK